MAWGDDGLLLAVVEVSTHPARRPRGAHQAKLYADCLEQAFGQRPVIYTNGFDARIWDDTQYRRGKSSVLYSRMNCKRFRQPPPWPGVVVRSAHQLRHYRPLLPAGSHSGRGRSAEKPPRSLAGDGDRYRQNAGGGVYHRPAEQGRLDQSNVLFLAGSQCALIHQAKVNLNDYSPNLPAVDLTKEKGRRKQLHRFLPTRPSST